MFGNLVKPRLLRNTDRMRPNPIDPVGVREDIGHFAPNPGSDYKIRKFLYDQKKRGLADYENGLLNKANDLEILRQEFIKKTSRKNCFSGIKKSLDFARNAQKQDLDLKREKLSGLLTSEDRIYENEFKTFVKGRVERDIKEREMRLITIKKERERQDEEFVRKKTIQQYMNKCDEIRPYLRQKLLQDSKACQLLQIKDKQKKLLEERDIENLWVEVAKRGNEQLFERENSENQHRFLKSKCDVLELKKQMEVVVGKRANERIGAFEERIQNTKNMEDSLKQEKLKEQIEKEKRMNVAHFLKAQLEETRMNNLQRTAQESEIDKKFNEKVILEMRTENSLKKAEEESKKIETKQYLDYLEEIKNEKRKLEKGREEIINNVRCNVERELYRKKQELKMQKTLKTQENNSYVRKQIFERQKKECDEYNKEYSDAIANRELYSFNAKMEEDAERRRFNAKLQYGLDLKEQQRFLKGQEDQEKERMNNEILKIKTENEFCEKMTKKFISEEIDVLPLHPHVRIMNLGKRDFGCCLPTAK